MLVVGELIDERYRLEELIGTGGMSSVFRAHDGLLDRRVALKILHDQYSTDEDYVERFRREARSVAQLSHPNIVTVIDRGESEGREFIVFEYIEGENLKQLLTRAGALPVRRALELAIQIGRALSFAHEHGLVHRDVKPQNVLLGNGEPKVTDFGIARTVDVHGLTQTGTVLGTSEYIAPEQASGRRASEQSDVYSLAVVLFELLTGRVPFTGENFVQVAMRHVNEPAPSVLDYRPDTPLRVAGAIARAMEKDPDRRFASMDAFVGELEACLAGLGESDRDPTMIMRAPPALRGARRLPQRRRRRIGPLALVAAGLIALVAAAAGYLLSRGDNGPATVGPKPAAAGTVHLRAAASYDPEGTDGEHDERIQLATDGNASTYWETEHYASQDFGNLKSGVGLVVDAGHAVRLQKLTVRTDTPGFTAEVKAGASSGGPFDTVSDSQTVEGSTTFSLHVDPAREYYLVWITKLAPGGDRFQTHVTEVTAG